MVALLAEAAQPMLADDSPVTSYVPERASAAFVALLSIFCDEVTDCSNRLVHAMERQWNGPNLFDEIPLCLELQAVYVGQNNVHADAVLFA